MTHAQTKSETPTLDVAIQAAINAAMLNLNTALPGTIESFDPTTNTASVQPSIKRKYVKDDEVVNLPVINSVPIVFPRAGETSITFPIKKGNAVLLIFSQRALDNWKNRGAGVEAGSPRTHALADCFAIPGGYPPIDPAVVDGDNLVMQNTPASKVTIKPDEIEVKAGAGVMSLTKDGKFKAGNGPVDITAELVNLIDQILALTVPTAVGPSGPPINAAAITAIKTKLELIKA